jgi:predicted anti-sigma-YlaC factor YlaD
MDAPGGQLCARARFWASLRVDGELSELEGALLDAHLARCDSCRTTADGFGAAAGLLRATPHEPAAPVAVDFPRSPRRVLAAVAVAAALVLGVVAGSIVRGDSSHQANTPRIVAVVASAETADQLRRLRRTSLLNTRRVPPVRQLPRDLAGEPV